MIRLPTITPYCAFRVAPLLLAAFCLVASNGCGSNTADPSSPLVLRVWHTESDARAKAVLQEVAESLEKDYRQIGRPLEVRIEQVSWGNLTSRLDAAMQSGNAPQLTHLEPFMTYELYLDDRLEPLDDLMADVEKKNGPIMAAVRDLQEFDRRHYGIAYAVGTTFFAYRKDWARNAGYVDDNLPNDWSQLLEFAQKLHEESLKHGAKGGTLLPGRDPFFMSQCFVELCASAGAKLWEPKTFKPQLNSPEVRRVVEMLSRLRKTLHPQWGNTEYLDQFDLLKRGEVAFVPVTYGRAALILETAPPPATGDDSTFGVMPQPGSEKENPGIATIDCENWSILRSDADSTNAAKAFLRKYYSREFYIRFCRSVPIHLTPIFQDLARSREYMESSEVKDWNKRWSSWYSRAENALASGNTRPILESEQADRKAPFLFQVEKRGIFSDLMAGALGQDEESLDKLIEEAQNRATTLWKESARP